MVIDLTELEERETPWQKQVEPEEIGLTYPDYEFAKLVHVDLRITRGETQYVIQGSISTVAKTQCVKCLEPFTLPVEEHIGWAVQVISNPAARAREDDSEDFWFIEKGTAQLDITSRVREAILINLPNHPKCVEDCRGLCPRCGANLNEGACACRGETTDSRWGPLKDILDKRAGSSE